MFDHIKFGVSDYVASKAFFLKALEPLGVAVVAEGPPTYGVELSHVVRSEADLRGLMGGPIAPPVVEKGTSSLLGDHGTVGGSRVSTSPF
jgi:hypothetical protein